MRLQQEERNVMTAVNDWLTRALLVVAAKVAFLPCFLACADVIEIVSASIVVICRRAGASVTGNVIVEGGDATPR